MLPTFAATLALAFASGCESSDSESDDWSEKPATTTTQTKTAATKSTPASSASSAKPAAQTQKTTTTSATTTTGTSSSSSTMNTTPASATTTTPAAAPTAADQVPFGALSWTYGGKPKAHGARLSGVSISGLSVSSRGLSFKYNQDLSAWGLANSQAGAVACLFVQNSSGKWVGGKFDWISSSRRSRSFENILGGYGGWSLANVPNPCPVAFVIVSQDGTRRSNVLAGTWSR